LEQIHGIMAPPGASEDIPSLVANELTTNNDDRAPEIQTSDGGSSSPQ